MAKRETTLRLLDMIEAIERVQMIVTGVNLEDFESDWEKRWLVERGLEILSEASRHLDEATKTRYAKIPWRKVADIGNVLRHAYDHVAADVLWKVTQEDLGPLLAACREELASRSS
jgi:uncharacterized protein with HEPN domain